MNKLTRLRSVLVLAIFAAPREATAANAVDLGLNAAAREYCHILRFPLGWQPAKPTFRLGDDYEFRVPGLQGTKFLIRAMQQLANRYYSGNLYEADFSDPKGIAQPATEEAWQSGTVVNWQHWATVELGRYIDSLGFQFKKTGKNEGGWLLSPGRALLVVESWSGILGRCGGNNDTGPGAVFSPCIDLRGPHGSLYFDVYNADTGNRLITLTAKFSKILPEEDFLKTGWVTERYFAIPLDEKRERCLVCEFGRAR
jgi:hypothetical protein